MAQHYCTNDKLDRGGCISPADRNLLRDRRFEGPRLRWQQDIGRARCGANDCLGSGVVESTRDMIKGEILGAPWGRCGQSWRKGEKALSRLGTETVVYS